MNFTRQSQKRGQTNLLQFNVPHIQQILVAILFLICNFMYFLLILLHLKCIKLQALPSLWWPTVPYKAWTLLGQVQRVAPHATIAFTMPDKDLICPLNVIIMQYGPPGPFLNMHNSILFWPTVVWSHRLSCHESTDRWQLVDRVTRATVTVDGWGHIATY